MTETINGLHKCQPKNEPIEGETKSFSVLHMPAKEGKKPWIKIKSESAEKGGSKYRVVSVTPTGWEPDDYGNVSFNLEIEAVNGAAGNPPQRPVNAPESRHNASNSGGKVNVLDERQRAIIRQHSQSMALEVLKLKVTLNELTVEDLAPEKLRALADYFDTDVIEAAQ
jgi:hypothetical protein